MSTKIPVKCSYCNETLFVSLKRFNEHKKNKWRFFCSKQCRSLEKKKGSILQCSNPHCGRMFYRSVKSINKSNNFCSRSCTSSINNKGRVVGFIKVCANSKCSKKISNARKYCSAKCFNLSRKISEEDYKFKVVRDIKRFVRDNKRIPLKKEMQYLYKPVRVAFGTWNNAIKYLGFDPNPVLFANKHIAKDGHICDSFSEKMIDDWLFHNNVSHKVNVLYPGGGHLTVDFLIGDTWIEFFGLYKSNKKYDLLVDRKRKLSAKYKLHLVSIFPEDLFPRNKLDNILGFLLKKTYQ